MKVSLSIKTDSTRKTITIRTPSEKSLLAR